MGKRVILIVLDSVGIGEMPDAAAYGDVGSDTLGHIAERTPGFALPNLVRLGLGNIAGVTRLPRAERPAGAYARLAERSPGKDTTTGHWEMMGTVLDRPWPYYPNGFPPAVLEPFERAIGKSVLANIPASGTEIIKDFGEEHLKTGRPIVYTSADSVFQIACHEEVVPIEKLYEWCAIARKILDGEHRVARVIARPFIGKPGSFSRTPRRHDFAVDPPATVLDRLCELGVLTYGVGKIYDIFNGRGVKEHVTTVSNSDGIDKTLAAMKTVDAGLIFTNLVDFDMVYGHRNDVPGYAQALMAFDARLPEIERALRPGDLLAITADHGCDPADVSTDHTREHVPLLLAGAKVRPLDLGTLDGFTVIGKAVLSYLVDATAAATVPGVDPWERVAAR